MATETKRSLRCAIYTRKSSEEGLEQSFNSLHAQREACLAYIQSQKHEGWKALATHYDDGGFSGGTLARPAMVRLLEDISAGKLDLVVVYKVDRLTRSLSDFARIVEAFDAKGVSFVSVTQAFNTSTSMGRLTLNVLLSFAQFEREVTGERIRDKIAASKKKGMWMGGMVPIGYDLKDRKLVVNEKEAETVRWIFDRYLELRSVRSLKAEMDEKGILTKVRRSAEGKLSGGLRWFRGALYQLLQNPIYRGEIRHKDKVYPGEHEAIVNKEVWGAVQATLTENAVRHDRGEGAVSPSLLVGCVVDDQGNRMIPSHTLRKNRRYRYYAAAGDGEKQEGANKGGLRIPAHDLEEGVWARLRDFLSSPSQLLNVLGEIGGRQAQVIQAGAKAVRNWDGWSTCDRRGWLKGLLERVVVTHTELTLHLNCRALSRLLGIPEGQGDEEAVEPIRLESEVRFKRGGRGLRYVIPGPGGLWDGAQQDKPLLQAIARGRVWYDQLLSGQAKSREEIARANGLSGQHVIRHLHLAWLAPDIVEAILEGRQPKGLTVKRLLEKLPMDWPEQRRVLGFEAKVPAS
jgi:DNA invertase Pin-like site-specific DNA recombinase